MNAIRQLLCFELATDLLAAKVAQFVGYLKRPFGKAQSLELDRNVGVNLPFGGRIPYFVVTLRFQHR